MKITVTRRIEIGDKHLEESASAEIPAAELEDVAGYTGKFYGKQLTRGEVERVQMVSDCLLRSLRVPRAS